MKVSLDLTYTPLPDGGAQMNIGSGGDRLVDLPMDRATALGTASRILAAAGVRRASFEDGGVLTVLEES